MSETGANREKRNIQCHNNLHTQVPNSFTIRNSRLLLMPHHHCLQSPKRSLMIHSPMPSRRTRILLTHIRQTPLPNFKHIIHRNLLIAPSKVRCVFDENRTPPRRQQRIALQYISQRLDLACTNIRLVLRECQEVRHNPQDVAAVPNQLTVILSKLGVERSVFRTHAQTPDGVRYEGRRLEHSWRGFCGARRR